MTDVVRRLLIAGRVQGVGFRYAFDEQARALGLRGWVRNRRRGDVEAIVAGPARDVDAIIAWARRGPPGAGVTTFSDEAATGEFTGFDIGATE
ncbi:MAG: acylphosphatase [Betaproteobacteria bacterium]